MDVQRELTSLRQQNEQLLRRAGDLAQALAAFANDEVDAVTVEASTTPLLLHAAQHKLRQNEQLLRAIFDGALDPMLLADDSGRFVDANLAACELFQLSRAELVGRAISEFAAPGYDSDAAYREFRDSGKTRGRFPLQRQDGSRRTLDYGAAANVAPGLHLSVLRDSTDEIAAADAVRESRDRLEEAQAIAHVGSFTSGLRFEDDIEWTNECCRIFGLSEGTKITVEGLFALVHPADRKAFQMANSNAIEPGVAIDIEHRVLRPDHRPCWVHARAFVQRDLMNGPSRMVGTVQDITERRAALDALRESEERYRRVVESTSDGVWVYDSSSITVFMNERMAAMLGYTVEEVVGQLAHVFAPRARQAEVAERIDRRRRGVSDRTRFPLLRKDGTEIWTSVQSTPVMDAEGRFDGGVALVTDVTAERLADEANSRLAAIVESSQDAILSVRLDGVVSSWNKAAEGLYQYSAAEMMGNSASRLIPDSLRDKERLTFERGARGEAVGPYDTMRRRKDASIVEVSATASPVRDAGGNIVGISEIARDLTGQRDAEAALKRSEEQFLHAQRMEAVGVLAGGVAHDFNNLLSVILSYSSILLGNLEEGNPMRADLEEIGRAGDRATDLTRQLLAFSRKQIMQPRVLDLGQVVGGMEKMLRRLLGEDVQLSLHVARGLGSVYADPGQVEQVVMNLAVNARDAMRGGGKLIIETANADLDEAYAKLHQGVVPGRYVMLAITDTGEGIDAATRQHIFEPFFTTKEVGKGTGLGLSTVFGIVKQSHGHIWVYSEVGQGTTFKVYFPYSSETAEDLPSRAAEPMTLEGSETILLVEDEEGVRIAVRTTLKRHGYNVLDCQNGGEAFLTCEQFPAKIHLLLTDVVMPRMSGRQLVERLKPLRPEMKVLYMSGYTEESIVHHGVLDAGIAFLQKPVTPKALLKKVREVLEARTIRA